ncbi:hypothetical protein D915_005573 [Fasciola hepatica]|uniref:Uncharacterized protein n=1 Tax=Fasciola hepatica TaxID=6192 RepID=A0A4E0RRU5_FASHE|nr:hypothetical protein D915_005573 [Fasciola hepatica]
MKIISMHAVMISYGLFLVVTRSLPEGILTAVAEYPERVSRALSSEEFKPLIRTPRWPLKSQKKFGQPVAWKSTEIPSFAFANDMRLAMKHRRSRLHQFALQYVRNMR